MIIKVLGSGCANCDKLEALVRRALSEIGVEAHVMKVTEISDILAYGVMATPALVIDEQVQLAGRMPSYEEVRDLITAVAES